MVGSGESEPVGGKDMASAAHFKHVDHRKKRATSVGQSSIFSHMLPKDHSSQPGARWQGPNPCHAGLSANSASSQEDPESCIPSQIGKWRMQLAKVTQQVFFGHGVHFSSDSALADCASSDSDRTI
jgi:hypothetical protein